MLFCPQPKKPKTARTAGRSESSRGALSPALSPAFLSLDASLPTKRFKARPKPYGGVVARASCEKCTQRPTGADTAVTSCLLYTSKFPLFGQFIVAAVYLIVLFGNMMADEHTAQAVEKHEVELIYVKESCSMLKAILSDISDKHLYRQVERAYDLIQASPVKSAASVHSIESQVINEIDNLGLAVRNGDAVAISGIADKIARLANERNRLLRLVN